MNGRAGGGFLAGCFLLALLVSLFSGLSASGSAEEDTGGILEAKTFSRWPDPVVADIGLFPSLLGRKAAALRLYAYSEGAFQPIPFQLDEKGARGNMVLPSGEQANPQEADGLMGKGEELVFMARDSGDRVDPKCFLPDVDLLEELELEDPLTGGKGWVYLLHSESDPPSLSETDYFVYKPVHRCDPEGDCLYHRSRYYEARQYPQEPYFDTSKYPDAGFVHNFLAVTPEAGGTGADFCDRYKVRITTAFLFGSLKFRTNENDMTFHENAYKDGPVRLIRNNSLVTTLPLGIKAPGAAVNIIWYDTITNTPLIIDIPFNPGYFYTYLEISIAEDRSREAMGMKVYNSNNREGCLVDGKMEGEAETGWNTDRDSWRVITGKQGTMMNRSFWDERYLKQMKRVTVEYMDDIGREDPPEEEPGMLGMIRQTNRVEGIKKDRYSSYLEWYYLPDTLLSGPQHTYRVGDEQTYLNIADHPVRLRAGARVMENHYFGQMPAFEEVPGRAEPGQEKNARNLEP